MRFAYLGILSLALVHCHGDRPTPPPTPTPAVTPATDVPPPAPTDVCVQAAQTTQRIIDGFRRAVGDAGYAPTALHDSHFGSCVKGGRDAWAIIPERVSMLEANNLHARWNLTYFDPSGKPATIQPAVPDFEGAAANTSAWNFTQSPGDTTVTLGELTVFDFNNDGVSEVFLPVTQYISEGPSFYGGRVWTSEEGAVTLYAPTSQTRISALRDADRDGRPDLVIHQPYLDTSSHCGSDFEYLVTGPELLMHSLPNGNFSANDSVAMQFARTQCPARPTAIIARGGDGGPSYDDAQSAKNVVCARLWGVTEAEVLAAIQRGCPAGDPNAPCGTCEDPDLLRQFARIEPPFTLR